MLELVLTLLLASIVSVFVQNIKDNADSLVLFAKGFL